MTFKLDQRLQADTHELLSQSGLHFRLHRNAEVLWIIIVPETDKTEFYQLDNELQQRLCGQINNISAWIQQTFSVDKINVATIGNVVSQMHLHVIGRKQDDAYWPDVVWGKPFDKTFDTDQIEQIRVKLVEYLQ